MTKAFKTIVFTAMLTLSLVASAGSAFAKDHGHARETAWTDDPSAPAAAVEQPSGVTWEE